MTRRVARTTLCDPDPSTIIGRYKYITAKRINTLRNILGAPVLQRNDDDHPANARRPTSDIHSETVPFFHQDFADDLLPALSPRHILRQNAPFP